MRRMQNENLSSLFFLNQKKKTCFVFLFFFSTSFPRYSQMAKLQLCSPLHTLITFDGHPAAEFQGGHVFCVTKENFLFRKLSLG